LEPASAAARGGLLVAAAVTRLAQKRDTKAREIVGQATKRGIYRMYRFISLGAQCGRKGGGGASTKTF
jgi:hypothetical protein